MKADDLGVSVHKDLLTRTEGMNGPLNVISLSFKYLLSHYERRVVCAEMFYEININLLQICSNYCSRL